MHVGIYVCLYVCMYVWIPMYKYCAIDMDTEGAVHTYMHYFPRGIEYLLMKFTRIMKIQITFFSLFS
jgi:hypothetical protein